MHVLIDTNVVLDVLLNRYPFAHDAITIFKLPELVAYKYISVSAVTDIYYIAYRELRDKHAVAKSHNFDAIITRNSADFKKSNVNILSPKDFLQFISKN